MHNPMPSTKQQEFDQVLRNQGLTEEEIERFNTAVGADDVVLVFGNLTWAELFPTKFVFVHDIDLKFLSGKKRCRLLRLKYLAEELSAEKYNWLTPDQKYQLFLRGEVNFITMGQQETLEKLMREVEHRATRWMATNLSYEELAECEL
jgi:hypothetical protein